MCIKGGIMPHKIETLIKDLIKTDSYRKQSDLVKALKEKGIETKQSTVSRALNRLGAVKRVGADGQVAYRIFNPIVSGTGHYNSGLVHYITANEVSIIIQTRTGSASHVAQYIDEQNMDEIIGTLAGDNCILILPKTVHDIKDLEKKLRSFLHVQS